MIPDEPTGLCAEVQTTYFEKHIRHLATNYDILSLDEIVSRIKNGHTLRRSVGITFDDGFKDNYENAYPILRRYQIPATIFLTTGYIDNVRPPWFIKVRHLFIKTQIKDYHIKLKNKALFLPMQNKRQQMVAAQKVMDYLQKCQDDERQVLLNQLEDDLEVDDPGELNDFMLNWNQIREMFNNNISFGAHTVNHPILSRLSAKQVEEEIAMSKDTIEEKLGNSVSLFAYPFGKKHQYNEKVISILTRLSFKCAVTTELGPINRKTNLFEMSRCFQANTDVCNFYWKPYF